MEKSERDMADNRRDDRTIHIGKRLLQKKNTRMVKLVNYWKKEEVTKEDELLKAYQDFSTIFSWKQNYSWMLNQ